MIRHFIENVYLKGRYKRHHGRAVGGDLLGAENGVKIVRPKVVADPAKYEYPKVALDPVPASGEQASAECEEPRKTTRSV